MLHTYAGFFFDMRHVAIILAFVRFNFVLHSVLLEFVTFLLFTDEAVLTWKNLLMQIQLNY